MRKIKLHECFYFLWKSVGERDVFSSLSGFERILLLFWNTQNTVSVCLTVNIPKHFTGSIKMKSFLQILCRETKPFKAFLSNCQACLCDPTASVKMGWKWWRGWYICFVSSINWRSAMRSTPVWRPSTSSTKVMKSSRLPSLNPNCHDHVTQPWRCCLCPDIRGLSNVSQLEQLNKRYWYVCQDYTEYKYPHQPKRFPEIMMCLPEIRCIAGKAWGSQRATRDSSNILLDPNSRGKSLT